MPKKNIILILFLIKKYFYKTSYIKLLNTNIS